MAAECHMNVRLNWRGRMAINALKVALVCEWFGATRLANWIARRVLQLFEMHGVQWVDVETA